MKYKFYITSEKAWVAMLEAIRSAKKSIYLESFILVDDAVTHNFFEALKEKAGQGVKIKIIIDRVGDFWWGSFNKEEFEKAGAEVLLFNRWLYRTHRKILIIDESVAFIGGVNIHGPYAEWLDLHMKINGITVKYLTRAFGRLYRLVGGRESEIFRLKKHWPSKTRLKFYKAKTWLIEHSPFKGRGVLHHYYEKKFAEARKKIIMVTPYFIPLRWLMRAMKKAAHRGVKIEVILPVKTDVWIADVANRVFARYLKHISDFYLMSEMNHAKVLLVDDREGMVGSNNLDAQSFDFNLEASLVFQRKDMVGDLRNILKQWKDSAEPFDPRKHRRWYDPILGFFIKILIPIL